MGFAEQSRSGPRWQFEAQEAPPNVFQNQAVGGPDAASNPRSPLKDTDLGLGFRLCSATALSVNPRTEESHIYSLRPLALPLENLYLLFSFYCEIFSSTFYIFSFLILTKYHEAVMTEIISRFWLEFHETKSECTFVCRTYTAFWWLHLCVSEPRFFYNFLNYLYRNFKERERVKVRVWRCFCDDSSCWIRSMQ